MLTLLLACTEAPKLGDIKVIDGQLNCISINAHEIGLATDPETALPADEELAEIRKFCKKLGYEWTYVQSELLDWARELQMPLSSTLDDETPIPPTSTLDST